MVEASQEQLGLWDADSTSTHLHSLLAIAIQRGNALMHSRIRLWRGGKEKAKREKVDLL
jgi:hypothetical protein